MARLPAAINAANTGTRTLIAAPGAGYKIRVISMVLSASVADGTATFKDSTPNTLSGAIAFDIDAQPNLALQPCEHGTYWFECADNTSFQVTLTGCDLDGVVVYEVVAA